MNNKTNNTILKNKRDKKIFKQNIIMTQLTKMDIKNMTLNINNNIMIKIMNNTSIKIIIT